MSTVRQHDDSGGGQPRANGGRVTVTVDFDCASNPELFTAISAVPAGKQRAQRVRSLMLKGLMVESMQGLPARMTIAPAAATAANCGADDVFGAPVDG